MTHTRPDVGLSCTVGVLVREPEDNALFSFLTKLDKHV